MLIKEKAKLKPYKFSDFIVVSQVYDTHGDQEYIIRGNAGVLKCKIPSFVADYLEIVAWHDSDGNVYSQDAKIYGEYDSYKD